MTRFAFADEVRAVLFDAGNTLLCIDHGRLASTLASAGVAAEAASVRRAELAARPRIDDVLGTVAKPESAEMFRLFANFLLDHLDASCSASVRLAAEAAIVREWSHMWSVVPPDAAETLDELARRGYRLGVISNADGTVREKVRVAGLADRFEFVIDSHEVGVTKPDPRIFAMAATRLGLPAVSCVYVGDLHSIDVLGARAARMHPVLIDPLDLWKKSDASKIARLSDLLTRLR